MSSMLVAVNLVMNEPIIYKDWFNQQLLFIYWCLKESFIRTSLNSQPLSLKLISALFMLVLHKQCSGLTLSSGLRIHSWWGSVDHMLCSRDKAQVNYMQGKKTTPCTILSTLYCWLLEKINCSHSSVMEWWHRPGTLAISGQYLVTVLLVFKPAVTER